MHKRCGFDRSLYMLAPRTSYGLRTIKNESGYDGTLELCTRKHPKRPAAVQEVPGKPVGGVLVLHDGLQLLLENRRKPLLRPMNACRVKQVKDEASGSGVDHDAFWVTTIIQNIQYQVF